jgi:uncharacterized membrane protein YdbT with pleckstrin-like domain
MKKFTASRLSSGNFFFPVRITLDERGVTLRIPSFFSGDEKTIPYSRISSVDVNTPMIGFSDIKINTTGEGAIAAHGFYKSEVKEIKEFVLEKIHSNT